MNPLINVSISFYFRVENAELFGGDGSIGYTAVFYGQVKNIEPATSDDHIVGLTNQTAKKLGVSTEFVTLISKEEYDQETADDEDDTFCDSDEGDIW